MAWVKPIRIRVWDFPAIFCFLFFFVGGRGKEERGGSRGGEGARMEE